MRATLRRIALVSPDVPLMSVDRGDYGFYPEEQDYQGGIEVSDYETRSELVIEPFNAQTSVSVIVTGCGHLEEDGGKRYVVWGKAPATYEGCAIAIASSQTGKEAVVYTLDIEVIVTA